MSKPVKFFRDISLAPIEAIGGALFPGVSQPSPPQRPAARQQPTAIDEDAEIAEARRRQAITQQRRRGRRASILVGLSGDLPPATIRRPALGGPQQPLGV